MATKVFCEWTFTSNVSVDSLDFNGIADSVQMRTLEYFAGDAEKGKLLDHQEIMAGIM